MGSIADVTGCTEIKSADDLFAPGAKPGTVPTDLEQSTGLERLEILGKMQGIDIFDMKPLDASRLGMSYPILWQDQCKGFAIRMKEFKG